MKVSGLRRGLCGEYRLVSTRHAATNPLKVSDHWGKAGVEVGVGAVGRRGGVGVVDEG